MISQKEIDELYSYLNIHNEDITVRNSINKGSLDNKLNTNYSAIYPDEIRIAYSAGVHEKIKAQFDGKHFIVSAFLMYIVPSFVHTIPEVIP